MRVRIEREVCTGAGDCARAVADVFWIGDDGLAMVKEDAAHFGETKDFADEVDVAQVGFTAWARVPESLEEAVEAAAANCPGTCIVVERPAPPVVEAAPEPAAVAEEPPAGPPKRSSIPKRIAYRLRHLFG